MNPPDTHGGDHDHVHVHDNDHGGHDHDDHDHEDGHVSAVPPPGPIAQSVAIGFLAIYGATLLLAAIWFASNARQIAPDSQAVVFRFGRIVRTQEAGLLLALPRPFEQVRLLPGPDRQLSQAVQALPASGGIEPATDDTGAGTEGGAPASAGPYLTSDGNVVLLDATLIYRIVEPRSYILAEEHVAPALDRLFRAALVQVAVRHGLNEFLVSQGNGGATGTAQLAGAVREELLQAMNARLQALDVGQGLGVEIERIDMTAWLPPAAKVAFDAVLTATQVAEQNVAAARTEAERRRQGADRERDRMLSAAQAKATETMTNAKVATARIVALNRQATPATRDGLLAEAWRTQVAVLMGRVGSTTVVDPGSAGRLIVGGDTGAER